MKTVYLIVKQGYEYNDQTYTQTEGITEDIIIYTDKEKAEKVAKEKTIKEADYYSLFDYIYLPEKLSEKFNKIILSPYQRGIDNYKELSDEEKWQILKYLNFTLYYVIESKIEN